MRRVVRVTQKMKWKGKMKKEGYYIIVGPNLKIVKVKNTVILRPGQGKWISLSYNFSRRKSNEFLFPVLVTQL